MDLGGFYDYLIKATGYENALLEKNDLESRGRLENIYELKSSILAYVSSTEEPTLHGFLEEIASTRSWTAWRRATARRC
jgi:DNA helicase-2/ATP-dependent DNA helicase PcrA